MVFISVLCMNTVAQVGVRDDVIPVTFSENMKTDQISVETGIWFNYNKSILLFDNGPLITHPAGVSGADTSMLQVNTLAMNTLGAGVQFLNGNKMADDFTLTEVCNVDSIAIFAYQTGSTTTSTITGLYLRVWSGIPDDPGSTVVWGDLTTNIMSSTSWTNIYRMSDNLPGTTRPIMVSYALTSGLQLQPGTYWLEWTIDGSLTSGPWAPPVTILGQTTTGNARQYTSAGWADFVDSGTSTPQGMPFKIYGSLLSHDVGVVSLVSPVTGELNDSEVITITIQNFGDFDESNFPVYIQMNGGTVYNQMMTLNLSAGSSADFTFSGTHDFSAPGQHVIKLWTELFGDADTSNDSLTVLINNTTGIGDNAISHFMVYPNPVVMPVRISGVESVELLQIYDIRGVLLFSDTPMRNDFYISFDGFKNGIYSLVIETKNGRSVHKLVK